MSSFARSALNFVLKFSNKIMVISNVIKDKALLSKLFLPYLNKTVLIIIKITIFIPNAH